MVRHRRFSLLDAMVFVVAVAVGLAMARPQFNNLFRPSVATAAAAGPAPPNTVVNNAQRILILVTQGATVVYPSVMCLAFANLFIACRQPRPPLRRTFGRPGLVACIAASTALLMSCVIQTPEIIGMTALMGYDRWSVNVWLRASHAVGFAVAGAWVTLAACGRWRPEHDGAGRLGRVIGLCLIIALVLEAASAWSSQLL